MGGNLSQRAAQSEQPHSHKDTEPEIREATQIDSDFDSDSDYEPDLTSLKRKAKAQKSKKAKRARKSAAPKRAKSQKPFRFFDLPAELRNYIYDVALTDNQPVGLAEAWNKYRRVTKRQDDIIVGGEHVIRHPKRFVPALLALNKQIYSEAAAILYGNEFLFFDTQAMYNFLAQIGSHRRFLKYVTIKEWGWGRGMHKAASHPAMTMLCDAVNLKKLKSVCEFRSMGPKSIAQRIYRDGHYWLEAVGNRMKNKTAALELLDLPEPKDHHNSQWRPHNTMNEVKTQGTILEELAKLLEREG